MATSWLNGFTDCHKQEFPKEPHNKEYMEGWLESLGWYAGYSLNESMCDDPKYTKGYEEGKNERDRQEQKKNEEKRQKDTQIKELYGMT
ncbi:hypothetical protein QUA07_28585 [Microcoleus sp. T3_A4]|uniref:hypothetical protein n=1 Tax=Microcoleus sp. T3_A4 TaxID=2818968 RepID=UPI002FD3673C